MVDADMELDDLYAQLSHAQQTMASVLRELLSDGYHYPNVIVCQLMVALDIDDDCSGDLEAVLRERNL